MRDLMNLAESVEFKNELDHDITVDVTRQDIDGVDGVMISIAGPDSDADNHVTRREAEVIHQQIGVVLSQDHDCETPGAMYDSQITDHEVAVSVKLPPEMEIPDMSEEQGQRFDDLIHNAMEEVIATMMAELGEDPVSHEHD